MSKEQDLRIKYDGQRKSEKSKYLKDNNLKIARGFKKSAGFKRIARNEKQALYRLEKKIRLSTVSQHTGLSSKFDPDKRLAENIQNFKDGFTNTYVFSSGEPFYNVLSYGSAADQAAVQFFKENKQRLGADFSAYIDQTEIGGTMKTYTNLAQYQIAIQELYQDALQEQKTQSLGSDGVMISVVQGDKDGKTFFYVNATSRK